jgi:hypothetical protein
LSEDVYIIPGGAVRFARAVAKYMSFVEAKEVGQPDIGTCDMIIEDKSN